MENYNHPFLFCSFISQLLFPFFLFDINHHKNGNNNHNDNENRVTPLPVNFGHVLEIHSIKPDYKSQGNKYGGNYRKCFHYTVQAVAEV
jgi:hypothetical protein